MDTYWTQKTRLAQCMLVTIAAAASLTLSGCVSFHAIEQERVDQGRLLTSGQNDPSAPKKIRKIVGVDIELPHAGPPAAPDQPVEKKPEQEVSVLPMKNLKDSGN